MIVTRMRLPRRTFLRGAGVALALPFLDAMVPALASAAASGPIRRAGFLYLPDGMAIGSTGINYWTPKGEGTSFELSPILSPLDPFRDRLTVVSGLSHRQADAAGDGNGDHTRGTATWLNGTRPKFTQGADVQAGTTVDQVAAREIGNDTPLPSLELGLDHNFVVGNCENGYSCVYMNTLAWRTPTTPLPTENNPRVVFERLFGDGGTAAERLGQMRRNRSLLDALTDQIGRLRKRLGAEDSSTVSDYVDTIREVERRIQRAEASAARPDLPIVDRPIGIPEKYDDHIRLMFDLLCLAYQADLTRVFTFMIGREISPRTFPEIGVPEPHHGLSHHRDDAGTLAKFAKVNTYQMTQFAYFLDKLRSTREGDGNLLDHSLLLYGGGLSNPNEHSHINLPLVLLGGAGGRVRGGRHLRYPIDTPMANLLVAMLDRVGVSVERLGDSTGKLDVEPLTGV
jgi:Protein of unknown function (DUF1552)